jgi:ribosomal protein S18 acetylase RimI-like enzyme
MLRRATAEDVESLAKVFRRSYGTLTFLPTLHTPEEDRAHFASVVVERDVWVSEHQGRIVGFAALDGDLLTDLYVDSDHQRLGIGSALLDLAKRERPAGFRLWVFQRNVGARLFYERHGCRLVELTDGSRNEEREPDALYEWAPQTRGV